MSTQEPHNQHDFINGGGSSNHRGRTLYENFIRDPTLDEGLKRPVATKHEVTLSMCNLRREMPLFSQNMWNTVKSFSIKRIYMYPTFPKCLWRVWSQISYALNLCFTFFSRQSEWIIFYLLCVSFCALLHALRNFELDCKSICAILRHSTLEK